jgi:hypothetical protein
MCRGDPRRLSQNPVFWGQANFLFVLEFVCNFFPKNIEILLLL